MAGLELHKILYLHGIIQCHASVENSYRPVARGYLLIGLGDLLQEAGSLVGDLKSPYLSFYRSYKIL